MSDNNDEDAETKDQTQASPAAEPEHQQPKVAKIDAVPRARLEGFQWNPMARFGEFLLARYALSPGLMWLVLQLGGLVAFWVFMRIALIVLGVLVPLLDAMSVPIAGVRGCIYLTAALFILSSHVLWREMNAERQSRLYLAYVNEGRNPDLFRNHPRAQCERARVLSRRAEERRSRNRSTRKAYRTSSGRAKVQATGE